MRCRDIAGAQTVVVAIRGAVLDCIAFGAGDRAEEYKASVRRWAQEKRTPVTIWTLTAGGGRATEVARRAATAIAV